MSLLKTTGLRAGYGDFQALFDIDLCAESGEAIAIIGANGAGKSTLLKALAGVVPVARGMVCYDGRDIGGIGPQEVVRSGIALVPEGRRLFPSLTVEENLQMGQYTGRRGEWTVPRVIELFPRIGQRLRQLPSSMSGGEQQMVAIARALLSNPRVLMCDELSLGLAPTVVKDIYRHLQQVRERGTTVIIVEQDVQQAIAASDRVYCMREGRICLEGAARSFSLAEISAAYFGAERKIA